MNIVNRIALPTIAQRNIDSEVTVEVWDSDTDSVLVPTAATLTLYDGSELVLSAVVATPGAVTSYTWPAAATTARSLSEHLLFSWSLTIAGIVYEVTCPGYLVRHKLLPVITDRDLQNLHTELQDFRDPDSPSFADQRNEAWINLQKRLLQKGRFPHLVLDPWALRSIHIYETFRIIFRDAAQSIGDDRYQTLVEEYEKMAESEWGKINFRYDGDEDGYVDDEMKSASPIIYLC